MTTHSERVPCTETHLSDFSRVKVDLAQTGFFAGREFRSFRELSMAASTTLVIKAVVPKDIILHQVSVEIESGQLRVATVVGGDSAGTYGETLPVFPRNTMSVGPNKQSNVLPVVVLTAGGTHTGGTELDVLRLKAGANQGVSASQSVGSGQGDERGVGANTYHFRLVAAAGDAVTGVVHMAWEERP